MANSNAYMADYMLTRYHARRAEAIEKLGGHCVECFSVDDLQIDHINPKDKSFSVSRLWSVSKARFEKELAKCQLLCKPCHIEKTRNEQSVEHGGGLTGKRNCHCDLCGPLKQAYQKRYR